MTPAPEDPAAVAVDDKPLLFIRDVTSAANAAVSTSGHARATSAGSAIPDTMNANRHASEPEPSPGSSSVTDATVVVASGTPNAPAKDSRAISRRVNPAERSGLKLLALYPTTNTLGAHRCESLPGSVTLGTTSATRARAASATASRRALERSRVKPELSSSPSSRPSSRARSTRGRLGGYDPGSHSWVPLRVV